MEWKAYVMRMSWNAWGAASKSVALEKDLGGQWRVARCAGVSTASRQARQPAQELGAFAVVDMGRLALEVSWWLQMGLGQTGQGRGFPRSLLQCTGYGMEKAGLSLGWGRWQ